MNYAFEDIQRSIRDLERLIASHESELKDKRYEVEELEKAIKFCEKKKKQFEQIINPCKCGPNEECDRC